MPRGRAGRLLSDSIRGKVAIEALYDVFVESLYTAKELEGEGESGVGALQRQMRPQPL